jgi:hypothetical protein
MKKNGITPKLFNSISQNAHMLCGSTVVFGSILLFHVKSLYYILPAYMIITGIKEFYYDQHFESKEVRGSNMEDWTFYQLGWVLAVMIYWIKGVL